MRYDSFPNSNKQPKDSLRAETPPVFTPFKQCFAYCFAHWRSPGVCILPSSFWSIALKCLDADQSTIPNMKGDILSFHMRHTSMICSKRLQRNSIRIPIEESYLVAIFAVFPVLQSESSMHLTQLPFSMLQTFLPLQPSLLLQSSSLLFCPCLPYP